MAQIGLLILIGIVVNNGIVLIYHVHQLRERGVERAQAILDAARDRLRPILMTTMSLVAGMLPLAIGTGPGAEERRAVAVVVIGGQTLCLLLTLLVTPVAYSYLDDLGQALHWRSLSKRGRSLADRLRLGGRAPVPEPDREPVLRHDAEAPSTLFAKPK
jgi:HAE1 family hydrophobic/amphiphilic exporter-1